MITAIKAKEIADYALLDQTASIEDAIEAQVKEVAEQGEYGTILFVNIPKDSILETLQRWLTQNGYEIVSIEPLEDNNYNISIAWENPSKPNKPSTRPGGRIPHLPPRPITPRPFHYDPTFPCFNEEDNGTDDNGTGSYTDLGDNEG